MNNNMIMMPRNVAENSTEAIRCLKNFVEAIDIIIDAREMIEENRIKTYESIKNGLVYKESRDILEKMGEL